MKGQFFIIGAIAFSLLFLVGFSLQGAVQNRLSDLDRVSQNVESEYPIALNLLLNDSRPITDLMEFPRFLDSVLTEKMVDFKTLWVVTEGTALSDMNLYAGNYMGKAVRVSLNVDGELKTLEVQDDSTNTTVFPGVAPEFNITIGFEGIEKTLIWRRDKTNLYALTSMGRGNDLVVREVIG